jgi:hypothetical protein
MKKIFLENNHVELKNNLISYSCPPNNLCNEFIISDFKIESNVVQVCENESEYDEKYTNSKLVFLKDECKFIFNNNIDNLFGCDLDVFLENLNITAKQDFKIASVGNDDCDRVFYARKKNKEFNYVIFMNEEWGDTEYFNERYPEFMNDEWTEELGEQYQPALMGIYHDLCSDPTLLAPDWFYN